MHGIPGTITEPVSRKDRDSKRRWITRRRAERIARIRAALRRAA